jgi:hypothetical protein
MRNVVHSGANHPDWKYSAGEVEYVVKFGSRLRVTPIGLATEQHEAICSWFEAFRIVGDNSDPSKIRNLMVGADAVLLLLDARPGMDRWAAEKKS